MMFSEDDKKELLPVVQPPALEGGCSPEDPTPPVTEAKSEVHNQGNVDNQVNSGYVKYQYNYAPPNGATRETPLEELPDELHDLPPGLHPFQDPRHGHMLSELASRHILLLTSYQESAAYATAYSLVKDDRFRSVSKRAIFPTRERDRKRSDLDLLALADAELLGKEPQILLIDIGSWCTLFDSLLKLDWGIAGSLCKGLKSHFSYLVLAVNEDLLNTREAERVKSSLPYYAVSHLRYLFARDLTDRAEELEQRILAAVERGAVPLELPELYQRVAKLLSEGIPALEEFLLKIEQADSLPLAVRKEQFQPVQPQDVFREESEIHRTVALVATYFPELNQKDFNRFVLLLLGDETTTVERKRQVVGSDGSAATLHEEIEERWSDRWLRNADRVFHDCYLRPVLSADGSWVVDFSEPYLRRELRGYLERHSPWYVRRQCQALQDSGVLFALDLSQAAVKGLVRLFIERALVEPAGFGSVWLVDVVQSLRTQIKGEPPASASPEETLAWLLEKLAAVAHLQVHFHGRLSLLIREMLDHETLRPLVREFFEFLIAARQHGALLGVVLYLTRSLRFAPHFDPLYWMRRLIDQGSPEVREQAQNVLVDLARKSGPSIYEFLAVIRSWLPEAERPAERFSCSNRVALEFPFDLSLKIAKSLPPDRIGVWPSRHPLFYALPDNLERARIEIGKLVEWLLDSRGAALETADPRETMRTAEVVRIDHVAGLIEHWAWVLEGGTEDGPAEGRALFRVIVEEIDRRIGAKERSWLQRSWQRRQDDYLRQAANAGAPGSPARTALVARRAKLDQLRMRFMMAANGQGASRQT